jgi:hypothetical protein
VDSSQWSVKHQQGRKQNIESRAQEQPFFATCCGIPECSFRLASKTLWSGRLGPDVAEGRDILSAKDAKRRELGI